MFSTVEPDTNITSTINPTEDEYAGHLPAKIDKTIHQGICHNTANCAVLLCGSYNCRYIGY